MKTFTILTVNSDNPLESAELIGRDITTIEEIKELVINQFKFYERRIITEGMLKEFLTKVADLMDSDNVTEEERVKRSIKRHITNKNYSCNCVENGIECQCNNCQDCGNNPCTC